MTFTIREPVMVEPLAYKTTRGCNKTMNNIDNIDLEYNFNNLRNMIQFNCAKLYEMSSKRYLNIPKGVDITVDGIKPNDKNWWVHMIENSLERILTVEISDAELSFDIATPHKESDKPFLLRIMWIIKDMRL